MTVAENLRNLRTKKGLTQKALAEAVGLSEYTIRKYEAGKFKPKIEQVEKIALVLDTTPFQILGVEYFDNTTDLTALANDVKRVESNEPLFDILIAIKNEYGDETATIIDKFLSMTDEGQQKVSEYIDDLIQISKYKK